MTRRTRTATLLVIATVVLTLLTGPCRDRDRVPARSRGLSQLHRADDRGRRRRGRASRHRQALLDRHELPGPPAVGGQDLRQRRGRRGRARGHVRRHPPRRRAHGDRDDAPHPPLARPTATGSTRGSRTSSTPARSGSSSWSTPTAPSTTSPAARSTTGARTASRRPARPRSGPTSTATTATAGAAAARRPARTRRPSPTAARTPFSTPEDRAMRDFLASRVVNGRQQIRAAITFHEYGRLVHVAVRLHDDERPVRHDGPGPRRPGDHRQAHGRHERLQARAGERPVRRLRDVARLRIRHVPDLRLHVRAVGGGLPRRLAHRVRDRPQQGGRAVPDGTGVVPSVGARAQRSGRRAAAPSTTTSRSPAAGPSTPTGPIRHRPAAGSSGRTRRGRPATARSSSTTTRRARRRS